MGPDSPFACCIDTRWHPRRSIDGRASIGPHRISVDGEAWWYIEERSRLYVRFTVDAIEFHTPVAAFLRPQQNSKLASDMDSLNETIGVPTNARRGVRAPSASVPAGPPLRTIPFSISNVDFPWLMRATLVGHVAVYPDALIVVAYADTVVTLARQADPAASDEEVRVALASGDQNGVWRTDHRSAPLPLSAFQAAAGHRGRDSVQFVIPGV